MTVRALVFDMDGTMVDSMPAHARSWEVFTRRHGIRMPVEEVLRRTTGLTGVECIRVLMGEDVPVDVAVALVNEKDEGIAGKPAPGLFLEAARRLGVAPADCIVFEDAPFGIEAARRAGMRAVALCTTHGADELSGPHVVAQARDYEQLMNNKFLETFHA